MSLLTHYQIKNEVSITERTPNENSTQLECARLIHAAVISRTFREKLLVNPVKSLEMGYCGEKFYFSREEKQRMQSIRAASLGDFASQLMQVIDAEIIPQLAYVL